MEPRIESRPEQPYVGVSRVVTLPTFGEIADRLPELFRWLTDQGVTPAGSPFLKYDAIAVNGEFEVTAGIPVAGAVPTEAEIRCGTLPAGRYATASHRGAPDGLVDVNAALLLWADERGLAWDMERTEQGERWACRLEIYHTDPREQPDPAHWHTDLAWRLAD